MFPQGTVFLFLRTSAIAHDDYSAEDHHGSGDLLPCQGVHAYADADDDGYDGLYIAVHAHEGWPDAFLTYWDEEICYECRADYQVGQFGELDMRNGSPVKRDYFFPGKRGRYCKCKKEYPFHECNYMIFSYQRLEYSKIHGKAQTVQNDHEYAEQSGFGSASNVAGFADDEIDDAGKADCNSCGLLPGYGLLDGDGGYGHCIYRRHGSEDGAVHRGDVWDAYEEGYLAGEEAQHRGCEYLQIIFLLYFFSRHEG